MQPLIGAIVRDLEARLPREPYENPTPEQAKLITDIYCDFDSRFQDRPDYIAWRCAIVPQFARRRQWLAGWKTPYSAGWTNWTEFAQAGAESSDPVIAWSTVAIAPELIDAAIKKGKSFDVTSVLSIFRRLYQRLLFELDPLTQCPASCGMAAVIFLMRFQSLRRAANEHVSIADVKECLDQIVHWIAYVDSAWELGQKINTVKLEDETDGRERLRASYGIREFDLLTKTLCAVPPFVWKNLLVLDQHSVELRRNACGFAYTAWRTARSRRIWETKYQIQKGIFNSQESKRKRLNAVLREIECVRHLSTALRDAEKYFDAAKVMYLLLRLIPDEFVSDASVQEKIKQRWVYFLHMKEAGLEVDSRFDAEEKHAAEQELREIRSEEDVVPANKQGFYLVLERDQRVFPEWSTVLNGMPAEPAEGPKAYIRRIMRSLADSNQLASPDLLSAGYALAHRYGYVRSAGNMLNRAVRDDAFEFTKRHILDFVHDVRRCMSLDPFGMHYPTAMEWQLLTVAACAKLFRKATLRGDWFTPTEKLWVHETLIGRTHTHHRSLGHANRLRLLKKAVGGIHYDNAELREFYDLEYNFFAKPLGVATSETIARFCYGHEQSQLGAPVFVSLLCMNDILSLVAVNKDGSVEGSEIKIVGLAEDLREIATQAEFWFKASAIPFDEQIGWPQTFKNIGRAVLDLVSKSDGAARVIVLSVEPHLAHLPWQQLIGTCVSDRFERKMSADRSATRYLVALVPNASAVTVKQIEMSAPHQGAKIIVSTDADEAISQVSEAIESTKASANDPRNSVCIVLCHGQQRNGSSLPAINLGNGVRRETIDDWIEILQSKHVFLHCCHSGDTKPVFMQELGGLPGIALALSSSVLIAPAAEVSGHAAVVLQNNLFMQPGSLSLGEKYIKAVSDDQGVCLYNFFGNPYEALISTTANGATFKSTASIAGAL